MSGRVEIDKKFETLKETVASLRDKIVRSKLYADQKDMHGPIQWGFADIMKLIGDLEVEFNRMQK